MLLYNGFLYHKERSNAQKTVWRCCLYDKISCPARCHVLNDSVLLEIQKHKHAPNPINIEMKKIYNNVKNIARNTQISTHAVISRGTLSISQAAQGSLPSLQTIKKYVQRIRNRDSSILPNPQTLSQLIIPDIYKVSLSGEVFLIHDNNSPRRTLVFASVRFIDALKNSDFWHCDGTFKVVPSIFTQLFTIHVTIGNTVIPAVYSLLSNKERASYEEVFAIIRGVVDGNQPGSILMDFEMSMMNAARNIFPDSSIKGCFFHLGQCIWRKIQESALVLRRYKDEPDFCLNIKTLMALAFLPPSDVIVGFETLVTSPFFADNIEELQYITDYFEDNWIGRNGHNNIRRNARFPIHMWNLMQTVMDGQARTNNAVEGWHSSFSKSLGSSHPNIWVFLKAIQKEQNLNEYRLSQANAGANTPQRRVYRDLTLRIENLVRRYQPGTNILNFLVGIAFNLNI
ncbi:hypothetical protein RF11_08087 [Thelohanellus kitauei]|uniref:MULE transposase domain-containing protein n=1 Tax=Thelohanellus kitauei TaxID=669202 RepID=A0A0C2MRG5_THEKT|nr:hypothetical protein RF11_08087 [Thelohanellus kitauei]